jgi:hypothetical protein
LQNQTAFLAFLALLGHHQTLYNLYIVDFRLVRNDLIDSISIGAANADRRQTFRAKKARRCGRVSFAKQLRLSCDGDDDGDGDGGRRRWSELPNQPK